MQYPSGWEAELASKWPVASFTAQRIRDLRFNEMVIPARSDVGAPTVRVSSKQDYKDQTTLNFDGEQVNFCSLGLPYTSSARPTGPYDPTPTYPSQPTHPTHPGCGSSMGSRAFSGGGKPGYADVLH